jgi:twitching motility protein PilT
MKTLQELDHLLTGMIQSFDGISDLLFVAGQKPQVEAHGVLETPALNPPEPVLTGERIERMARLILRDSPKLLADLSAHGSCDCSYSLGDFCRFRANIYRQNETYAMVMRRLQPLVPTMDKLGLPPAFCEIVKERNGLVFVTGGAGNGKSTTIAALLNEINNTSKVHVVTLEDPVEFLHPQMNSTFSQRELGRDFFSFPDGLRAALRQAPKVIFVGEIRDRETMEIALIAGETGHLVFSTLHTISADQTIYRILGMFSKDEEQQVRRRLAVSLRYIVGQRLVPKKAGGRALVTELMGSNLRTREAIELGEGENRRLHDIIEAGGNAGWHSFEQSLLKAYEQDLISEENALLYSVNKPTMRQRLDVANMRGRRPAKPASTPPMMVVTSSAPPSAPPVMTPPPGAEPPPAPRGMMND